MSHEEVAQVAHQIEHSHVGRDGTLNLQSVYKEIADMQRQDGGPNSLTFRHDMQDLNNQLHREGLLPNVQIVSANEANQKLVTADVSTHRVIEQDPSRVNDFSAPGSTGNFREMVDGMRAQMPGLNVERLPDGGYDVRGSNPFANPNTTAAEAFCGALKATFGNGGSESGVFGMLGMNKLEMAAWRGWPPTEDQGQEQAQQQARQQQEREQAQQQA
jgi:hypothetical protein